MNLPPYKIFPEIIRKDVELREILPADITRIIDISYYDAMPATSLAEAVVMQGKIQQDYHQGSSIHWGIADSITHQLVGTCGYYRGFAQKTGKLGVILKPEFRGQGYMTAALKLAIDFGFTTIGLQKIIAVTSHQNYKAQQLLARLNFIKVAGLSEEAVYELT